MHAGPAVDHAGLVQAVGGERRLAEGTNYVEILSEITRDGCDLVAVPFSDEGANRVRQLLALRVPGPHQLGERLRVPAVDHAVADDGRRHAGDAERLEVTPPLGLGLDVEPLELHSP